MSRRSWRLAALLTASLAVTTVGPAGVARADAPVTNRASLKSDLCYQIATDRFFDGNTGNNNPAKSPGLYDAGKSNWKLYWGGDFAGIQQKLDYLQGLGVTSIWISPHVDNIDVAATYGGVPNAGYHGYWTRDFKKTEEHFGTLAEFDALIAAAHSRGIKVIMDWAPNHTSPADESNSGFAENGRLYDNGTLMGGLTGDTNGYFHHNGGITDYNDRYQSQYKNLADLADLNQQHPTIDSYLKTSADYWMNRGVDGVRVDAVKHMTSGWQRSMTDRFLTNKDSFLFGEWYLGSKTDPLYDDNVRFANESGISVLDFYLNISMRETFGSNVSMHNLDAAISKTATDYRYPENLVTFVDNHDMSRFLTLNNNQNRLHQALAFMMTVRGTPCVYYGTEQYLHNNTAGGGDPYNRPMMPGFNTGTTAYQMINKLSTLRQNQPALSWGTHQSRWINNDVYVYERRYFNDVVLTAINKGGGAVSLTGLNTALPAGTYTDQLTGLMGAGGITVGSGTGGNNPVTPFSLGAGQVGVWSYKAAEPTAPTVGSVGPTLTRPGHKITVEGRGFGASGTVKVNGVNATTVSWSPNRVVATVPAGVTAGLRPVTVTTSGGTSNAYQVQVVGGAQIPVKFTVNNASPTGWGDNIYLSGSIHELGNWSSSKSVAIGPMLAPNYPNWNTVVSLPACSTVQFKFLKITSGGAVTWENGANKSYTVPCSGTGSSTTNWQY
ncbi:alpha-amylase family glycosyl hydrolase [Polymorphospora rubra]|uniref:alpha-amylase n=1 Tax=Polymorphospora rubra TaxID=338584 RepID=A0A810MYX0_9ACTN|nr:alpha-amylase family glycosyl hydrolase [Polymorphospora rubra]BCJ66327.1 putative cyclomaltodextrin glucanotransferase [Polymorphospora rubra]